MKTPFNRAAVLEADKSPYVRLYQAVIFRALHDLEETQHRTEARRWLLSPESDHAFATAGINPATIRRQMTRFTIRNRARVEQSAGGFMLRVRRFADAAA